MDELQKRAAIYGTVAILAISMLIVIGELRNVQVSLNEGVAKNDKVAGKKIEKPSIKERANKSDLVLDVKALRSNSFEETNSYGDKYLLTKVTVSVEENMKGSTAETIDIYMIGGTANGFTMRASHQPEPLATSESALVFLNKDDKGRYRTYGEDKLLRHKNEEQIVEEDGSILDLSSVRAIVIGK